MDQETVRRIAEEVARLSGYPWSFLVVQLIVTLLAAGLGAFFAGYLNTRGKNLATTADFDRLQNQLSANTKLVETIKAEVGLRDWAAREWTNLRRVKLEELLNKVSDCESYRERFHRQMTRDGSSLLERNYAAELDTIATLYFPELKSEVSAYLFNFHDIMRANNELGMDLAQVGNDINERKALLEAYRTAHDTRYPAIRKAQPS